MALKGTDDGLLADLFKIIIALFLPPLGVLLEVGFSLHFWVNIVLTLLGIVPGMIHAVYVIATR